MDCCVFYSVRSLSLGGAGVLWGPGRGWWGMMGRGVQPEVTRSHYGGQEVELCTTTCGFVPVARQRSAGVTHASVAAQRALRRLRLSGLRVERKGRLSPPRVSVYYQEINESVASKILSSSLILSDTRGEAGVCSSYRGWQQAVLPPRHRRRRRVEIVMEGKAEFLFLRAQQI